MKIAQELRNQLFEIKENLDPLDPYHYKVYEMTEMVEKLIDIVEQRPEQFSVLRSGDKVLVKVSSDMDENTAKQIGDSLQEWCPDVDFGIIGGIEEIAIHREEKSDG